MTEFPTTEYDVDRHEFMFTQRRGDRLGVALKVRRGIGELPVTAATFTLSQILDDLNGQSVPDGIVELAGSWPVPDHFPQAKQSGRRFVNPEHPNAIYYSDVSTRCECGALVSRMYDSEGGVTPAKEQEHDDRCPTDWRLEARARLCDNRRSIVRRQVLLGHSVRQSKDRLGIQRDSLGTDADDLGIAPISELKENARDVLAQTWAELSKEHAPSKIGKAYDSHGMRVRTYIDERTEQTPRDLFEIRRQS